MLKTVAALLLIGVGPALGQSVIERSVAVPDELQLTPGHARMMRFNRSFATVIVGDPEIIKATIQSDRILTLQPVGTGATNLFLLDEAGGEMYAASVVVSATQRNRVWIYSKPSAHEYWAYYCTDRSCTRVKDEFEGQPPREPTTVQSSSVTIFGPGGAATQTRTNERYAPTPTAPR